MFHFKNFRPKLIFVTALGIISFILVLVVINTFGLTVRNKLTDYSLEKDRTNLPPAIEYSDRQEDDLNSNSVTQKPNNEPTITVQDKNEEPSAQEKQSPPVNANKLPETVNLNVPFTSQAPSGNWDQLFKEACEEASILMADKFYQERSFGNAGDTETEIKNIVEFEEQKLDFGVDTNAEQTKKLLQEYFGYKNVRVIYDITIKDIKKELANGKPVIIPAAGRMLGNPYYRQPGPLYHMLVIKGYTETKFITNDPGTRNGKDFTYTFDKLYNAIHDWNNGNVNEGKKVMIVVD